MTTLLQYYEKNDFPRFGLSVILLFLFQVACFSQMASFRAETRDKCVPARVVLYNQSSAGPGIKYEWDFGNGTISNSSEEVLEVVYAIPGTYTIVLQVIEGTDTVSTSSQVTIYKGPEAHFTTDKTEGCVPLDVTFTNTSTAGDASLKNYSWDFRDGTVTSSENTGHRYNTAGTFDVYFSVADFNGCSDDAEYKGLITVHTKPELQFSASDTMACSPPLYVNFTNQTITDVDLSYHWDFGNGLTANGFNAATKYSTSKSYSVTLSCSSETGCAGSLTKDAYINVGSRSISLYARQGDSVFSGNGTRLCPDSTLFYSNRVSTDYTWHVRYNNQQFTRYGREFTYLLTDSGTITLSLVVGKSTDCPDSNQVSFNIDFIKSDFDINPAYTCQLPVVIELTDQSEGAAERKWIFPDLTQDTAVHVSYTVDHSLTYEELYSHTINHLSYPFGLVSTSPYGCSQTTEKVLNVSLPVARFVPDKVAGCVPLKISFADSSKSAEPVIKQTYFIHNNAYVISDGSMFSHTFTEPGHYNVIMAIENSSGCSDTSYNTIVTAGDKLKPDFTISPSLLCAGTDIILHDITKPADSIDYRHFSSPGLFTITTTGTTASVEINPDTAGVKEVRLEVSYNGCLSDTVLTHAFTVNPPAGNYHEYFSCDNPMLYTFIADVPLADSLAWIVNDSIVSGADSMQFKFKASGDYRVSLSAFSNATLCHAEIAKIIRVRNVKAGFLCDPLACVGDSVSFNATSSVDYIRDCFNEGFLWDFGDGSIQKRTFLDSYSHIYSDTGIFHVKLVVRADNGCEDTLQKDVSIRRPDADFTADVDSGCASGLTVRFTKTGTDTIPVTWDWNFGDGYTISSLTPVQHDYTSPSSHVYTATLKVKDSYGCIYSNSIPITLIKPEVSFTARDPFVCVDESVNFTAPYSHFNSFEWDFGDGSTSAIAHSHTYRNPGTYDVSLKIIKDGCEATLLRSQYISVERADATFNVNDSIFDCYPALVSFQHTGDCIVSEGIWTFDTGIQSPVFRKTYQYTYSKPGIYNTSLWIRTPNGCEASRSRTIQVTGPVAAFEFSPDTICYGDSVSFHILSLQDVNETEWIFGDGETSTDPSPVHRYLAKGVVYPALRISNNSCEITINGGLLSISLVTASFELQDNRTAFCEDELLTITDKSIGYENLRWIVNDTLIVDGTVPAPFIISNPDTIHITGIATDSRGCRDTTEKTIMIVTPPDYSITGDSDICKGNTASLNINPVNPSWSVSWQPVDGIDDTASFSPVIAADTTRYYMAVVTDSNGCASAGTFRISVEQPPGITRSPLQDTSIYLGESIQLYVETDNPFTYTWSPDYNISCTSCQQPVVAPEHDIVYTVTINDDCFTETEKFGIDVIIDFYIEAPDAFSPNGDRQNDIFMIETRNIREIKEFKIFNRWGDLVFETTRLDEGWDGTVNGNIQNIDTYAYFIRAVSNHGYETVKKGNFMLVK
jgi:gliding motility-associated-like protein